ncbi:tubulin delta chain [Protopterus annectens]|uniref:tubulin delta chain n=1 Tax=Protopterus annectens TaxID=7888 RepID=UPI001CF960CF|nr:tubulin delta chain [Protopterus annectens]
MEPKVISQTLLKAVKSGKWKYGEKSYFCQKQGSGNNWADGFCAHGPRHTDVLMNMIQHEVEKCEHMGGFFTLMSMAGGTGSGLGTYITQCLRDAYPKSFFLNEVIWPYGTGEVIVQNYNSVLTLSHLYQSADALLVHENDTVHKICAQLMGLKHISFKDVNQVIAHQLGGVLQPAYSSVGATAYGQNPVGNLLESLSPHPEYKLISIFNIPQMAEASLAYSAFTWPGLLKHLRQMLIASSKMEEGINWQVRPPPAGLPSEAKQSPNKQVHFNSSVANLIVLRGKDVDAADTACFKDSALYTSWIPPHVALNVWRTCRPFNKYEKSATLVSNSQCLLKPLDSVVRKAWNMFASKAYVHQYTKHGITEDDFLDSFAVLEQVISSYSSL